MRPPYPWFGGKRKVVDTIWSRLGDVTNYVEPFLGSASILLMRPSVPKIETVNDVDCMVANFWRAVSVSPEIVAEHADHPVNEADLRARHEFLIKRKPTVRERCMTDPEWFDAKVADWWVWGISQWIGDGWVPDAGNVHEKIPRLGSRAGVGVHPIGDVDIHAWFNALRSRLRGVWVCCGDWTRIMGESVIFCNDITGIVFDPPYDGFADVYSHKNEVFSNVAKWAIDHGQDARLRIALCGYEGSFTAPDGWETVEWKANGGYGNMHGNMNAHKERIWFSPACLKPNRPQQRSLF